MACLQCTHNRTAHGDTLFISAEKTVVREQIEFEDDGVQVYVILEWDELSPLYSINVTVTPETHVQVNISSSAARLIVPYNMTYNVTVVVSHLCDQSSETIFSRSEVYYYARECVHKVMNESFLANFCS